MFPYSERPLLRIWATPMTELPYMPLYVDDFDSHTAHLTVEEDGIYNRLLRLCWRSPECMVPDDEAWLMRRLRIDRETYDRVARGVIEEFFSRRDGRMFQKRQRKEYERISAVTTKRKASGSKGGRAKALKSKEIDASKTSHLSEDNYKPDRSNTPATITISIPRSKEEEGACAREAESFSLLRSAVGLDPSAPLTRYWQDEAVEPWVTRWRKVGLSDDQILAEAKASRAKNPEPPEGPKALNAWMMQAATNRTSASSPPPEGVKAQAAKVPMSPEKRLEFWAEKINGPDYVPNTAVSSSMRNALIATGLVTEAKMRERGL